MPTPEDEAPAPGTLAQLTEGGRFRLDVDEALRIMLIFDRPMRALGFDLADAEAFHSNLGGAIEYVRSQLPPRGPAS